MASSFNELLDEAGIPVADVRLVRHKGGPKSAATPYDLWRDDRPSFDLYQSIQAISDQERLAAPYWAVFAATPNKETVFLGLYKAKHVGLLDRDTAFPSPLGQFKAGSYDKYKLTLSKQLREHIGTLSVDWSIGQRAWIQKASNKDKVILSGGNERAVSEDLEALLGQSNGFPTTTRALVDARLGQGKFRSLVLELWGGQCAVTGASTLVAIRASHIKPWCKSTDAERLDPHNGLPLVANLDALFDAGLITFDDSGVMLISSKLTERDRELFGLSGRKLSKKPSQATLAYLRGHRTSTFKK